MCILRTGTLGVTCTAYLTYLLFYKILKLQSYKIAITLIFTGLVTVTLGVILKLQITKSLVFVISRNYKLQ